MLESASATSTTSGVPPACSTAANVAANLAPERYAGALRKPRRDQGQAEPVQTARGADAVRAPGVVAERSLGICNGFAVGEVASIDHQPDPLENTLLNNAVRRRRVDEGNTQTFGRASAWPGDAAVMPPLTVRERVIRYAVVRRRDEASQTFDC